jgi:hypothetical protein
LENQLADAKHLRTGHRCPDVLLHTHDLETLKDTKYGGFLSHGCTSHPKKIDPPNHPKKIDHFSIETHGDLGVPHFKKPPMVTDQETGERCRNSPLSCVGSSRYSVGQRFFDWNAGENKDTYHIYSYIYNGTISVANDIYCIYYI